MLLFRIVANCSVHFWLLIRKQLVHYYVERMKSMVSRDCNLFPEETDVFLNTL